MSLIIINGILISAFTSFWSLSVSVPGLATGDAARTYQVVIRPDAKQFSEVAEGHRSVCFEAEIWEMVGWGEVAAFTEHQGT